MYCQQKKRKNWHELHWHRWKQIQLLIFSNIRPGNYSGLQPGSVVVVTTQSGMTIQIHKPKEEGRG
ncbi:hypothetical protein DL284_05725 [Escherichia coli]|nr:hypothetical protein [Escherichia coli]